MNKSTESPNGETSIEVRGLWKIFGHNPTRVLKSAELRQQSREDIQQKTGCVVALRDVSFSVQKGELFVIMGLSGSGKSTLIRCVPRLIEPTAGEVLIDGKNVLRYGPARLRDMRRNTMSMVFQHYGLFPHRTVIENVAYGLKVRGIRKDERYATAEEAIAKVGLKGWENHYPNTCSGGMQQRVGLARALTNDPEILLMDEPFSGLDPLIRRQMQDQLIELQSELHKSILFVTHDLDEALKLGSRIALMKDGEIIQMGNPEQIVTNPSCDYVRQFVQDVSPAKVLTASSIMTQPNCVLYGWMGPQTALVALRAASRTYGFVAARGNKYLGLVTMKGLEALRCKGVDASIGEALEPGVPTTKPDAMVETLPILAAASPYHIPVVDDEGKLLGEISNEVLLSSMSRSSSTSETASCQETTSLAEVKEESTNV